jgi:hypothetical protein
LSDVFLDVWRQAAKFEARVGDRALQDALRATPQDLPLLTARSPKRSGHLIFRFVKRTFALQQIYSITSKSRDAPPAPIEPPISMARP